MILRNPGLGLLLVLVAGGCARRLPSFDPSEPIPVALQCPGEAGRSNALGMLWPLTPPLKRSAARHGPVSVSCDVDASGTSHATVSVDYAACDKLVGAPVQLACPTEDPGVTLRFEITVAQAP